MCLAAAAGSGIDYIIIVVYFVAILGFGSFFGRYARSTKDFFFGGQKFTWWLIAMSMVATGVGSYSFIKYSRVGFLHGMSSSMTYMNDWFFIPFFMFGWLPIIYLARVRSIPEYFERRFDTKSRIMAVVIILLYMIGYIGFNFYTLGVAANAVLGLDLRAAVLVIAAVSAVYITLGGQTAVIFTDLVQGFMLLAAGLVMLLLGLDYLGLGGGLLAGLGNFWRQLDLAERLPFAHFNRPPDFNFVGIFWQDGFAASIGFLFLNQGVIMRFLAAKSVDEGRKTILFNTLLLLPLSMIAVGSAGWIGNALESLGLLRAEMFPGGVLDADKVFVAVAERICQPGVFGFVLAALTAALMSTIDTLINAVTAVFVYDVYQPYLRPRRGDRHYLRAARVVSVAATIVGLSPVLIFTRFESIYAAHGAFIAVVTPPLVVSVFLGAFWRRYTPAAAFWSMLGGALLIYASIRFPQMIWPFGTWLHGVDPAGGYKFMRAFFGIVASAAVGVAISLFTRPKPAAEIAGLWIGSVNLGYRLFKGGPPNFAPGKTVRATLRVSSAGTTPATSALSFAEYARQRAAGNATPDPPQGAASPPAEYPIVRLSSADMKRLKAGAGDLLYLTDARRWLGGLRSLHCRAGQPHDSEALVLIRPEALASGNLVPGRAVRVEKLF